jgi:hypothetical protein
VIPVHTRSITAAFPAGIGVRTEADGGKSTRQDDDASGSPLGLGRLASADRRARDRRDAARSRRANRRARRPGPRASDRRPDVRDLCGSNPVTGLDRSSRRGGRRITLTRSSEAGRSRYSGRCMSRCASRDAGCGSPRPPRFGSVDGRSER